MPTLHSLVNGESIVYIATRLFDHAEKIKAEDLENAVLNGVNRAIQELGSVSQNPVRITFVPYRDTAQNVDDEPNPAVTDLNLTIYLEDTDRLRRSFALIGFFDGLSKDEGVSMEIGYTYGIGRPIILAMTDFVRLECKGIPNSEHLCDPVIHAMASKIIYQHAIPEIDTSFRDRLWAALDVLYSTVEKETYLLCLNSIQNIEQEPNVPLPVDKFDVCIDFGGGIFEWQRILQDRLAEQFLERGISFTIGERYSRYMSHSKNYSIEELGSRDIEKVRSSKLLITCSDCIEMNSGTAALQGYACAIGKQILLYDSKRTNMIGDNHYKSSRNLMIDYSADRHVSKFDHVLRVVEMMLSH